MTHVFDIETSTAFFPPSFDLYFHAAGIKDSSKKLSRPHEHTSSCAAPYAKKKKMQKNFAQSLAFLYKLTPALP